jgi:uncharacterized protein DUF1302
MKRILLIFLLTNLLFAQGLFESALQLTSSTYELAGDIRSAIYVGGKKDSLYSKRLISQANLKLKAQKENIGYAFADIRFSNSNYMDKQEFEIKLREAYVDVSLGGLNLRLGKQILPWGRVDVFRSIDNITPKDMRYISIDPDDMRIGNFLVNSSLQIGSGFGIQGIWIPIYSPNLIPISMFEMPPGVQFIDMTLPDRSFENSGGAMKIDIRTSEFDAAFSYQNLYALQPGFAAELQIISPTQVSYDFFPKPWRQEVFGFDAAMNYNAWSIRCEGTYMIPENENNDPYIPNSEIQLTLGLDRSWRALQVLFEYNFKLVNDYCELIEPNDPGLMMDHQLAVYNRLFFRQTEEYLHNIFARAALSMFHETLSIETSFSYNLSTDEFLVAPLVKIDMADALALSLGMNFYHGDDETLFNLLNPLYKGYYCELKLTF